MPHLSIIDIVLIVLAVLDILLLFIGVGKFAVYDSIDSLIYLFAPRFSLKYDYRKYYPNIAKDHEGKVLKTFRTSRDEYYPETGPIHERIGDFFIRFPFFLVMIFLVILPMLSPYLVKIFQLLTVKYPLLSNIAGNTSTYVVLKIFLCFMCLPIASLHAFQVSAYIIVVYPFVVLMHGFGSGVNSGFWLFRKIKQSIPMLFFATLAIILFSWEVTMNYVGFVPIFHKGIMPFTEASAGLKEFIFWVPIKFKVYVDLILLPLVVVVPFVTSIGSHILTKHDAAKTNENINHLVLFYKTGISYFYAPLLALVFPRLGEESRVVRNERKINEILVICMYLESLVCVLGTGYAYYSLAITSGIPLPGIIMGLLVLLVFIPLIVFSTNGFLSHFLSKVTFYFKRLIGQAA